MLFIITVYATVRGTASIAVTHEQHRWQCNKIECPPGFNFAFHGISLASFAEYLSGGMV
jgi:hypothetical protein